MSKKCARCLKTVYPVEELKCLDKVWHKSCFRCTVCGMALTLKNYKGFDRMPYCSAHTPKAQATSIASTPEMKRLTNNTRIQSNIKYHEEYERGKRHNSQTVNGAETVRSKPSSKMCANVAYRVCKFEHKNIVEQRKRELDEGLHKNPSNRSGLSEGSGKIRPSLVNIYQAKARTRKPTPNFGSSHSNSSNCTDSSTSSPKFSSSDKSSFGGSVATMSSSRSMYKENFKQQRLNAGNAPEHIEEIFLRRNSGKAIPSISSAESMLSPPASVTLKTSDLDDYDEFLNGSSVTLTANNRPRLVPQTVSKWKQVEENTKDNSVLLDSDLADHIDNLSLDESDEPSTSLQTATKVERKPSTLNFNVYRAIYDFDASGTDEVSFREGDIIYEVEKENSGWITGRVERTGKIGMFPGNYVEKIKRKSQLQLAKESKQPNVEETIVETLNNTEKSSSN